ncbi:TetR/AcrR family transcriptional regulator [Ideonella margarita]|uniref:CerR family C-terminal domain-containing protein n=1 Tax=Ideonella margarita TaxID=2984191 RepID=A0ABU9C4K1_9BURK
MPTRPSIDSSSPAPATLPRADGEASRARLMEAGLRLFAEQGYARTSTRDLAQAAEVNVAAIRYYFGDKAGLYKAVFFEPLTTPEEDMARFGGGDLSLDEVLAGFYECFLMPLMDGDTGRWCIKLRMREMLEPTGLWAQEVQHGIQPMHNLLAQAMCRHLGVAEVDDDIHRLVIALSALGVHLHVGHDVIAAVAPQLNQGDGHVARWGETLVRFAKALVAHEAERRAGQPALRAAAPVPTRRSKPVSLPASSLASTATTNSRE